MAQRLDEGPLSLDPFVQQLRGHPASPLDGLLPQPFEDVPGFAVPVGIGGPHLDPVRVAAVELRLHQGRDVDPVDPQVFDVAADVHVHQGGTPDHDPGQINQVEARVGQVDVVESGVGQVLAVEVSHPASFPSGTCPLAMLFRGRRLHRRSSCGHT
jgi:hypothetical protein